MKSDVVGRHNFLFGRLGMQLVGCDFFHTMDSSDNKNVVVDIVCLYVQGGYKPRKFSPSADVDWSVV